MNLQLRIVTANIFSTYKVSHVLNLLQKKTAATVVQSKKSLNKPTSVVADERFENICLQNEPTLQYTAGSEELKDVQNAIKKILAKCEDIPIVINGEEIRSGQEKFQVMPHLYRHQIAKFGCANEATIKQAIGAAVEAQTKWDRTPLTERANIWENAASLMAQKYRADLVAATMLGQSKTLIQAEIDAAAELIDFTRLNAAFLKDLANYQPINVDVNTYKNYYRFRGLEGFVAAITPFNFTAIGGNLAYTPALMGNAVVWKPAPCAMLANWIVFKIMREAGVPDGVVNFVPCDGPTFGDVITASPHLAGINFTGSSSTFEKIWKLLGNNIHKYNNAPRLIGECGGKNFHFVHPSADVDTVVACTIRSAFEYSGQKCASCSRLYVPESIWEKKIMPPLLKNTIKLEIGDVCDFNNFLSAVIDEVAMQKIVKYVEHAKISPDCRILVGGRYLNLKGYFIEPTIVEVTNPHDCLMKDEIFGPILSVYVYKDVELEKVMDMAATTSKYGLTGSVFGSDESFLRTALDKFKYAAGNLYINDKSTGSIVGQQPFGGSRASGTNDKAGSPHYLLRWTSPQSIKETYVPMNEILYPFMTKCK